MMIAIIPFLLNRGPGFPMLSPSKGAGLLWTECAGG
jgi:hypothetical protein